MPQQGTKHGSALAVWLNRVGMTSREFMRRTGIKGFQNMSAMLKGEKTPQLVLAYEIERITEGGVPMECWMTSRDAKTFLKECRSRQPEEFRPKKERSGEVQTEDDEAAE